MFIMRSALIWANETKNAQLKAKSDNILLLMCCEVQRFLSSVSSSVGLALVVCGELAFCHGEELGFDDLFAEW